MAEQQIIKNPSITPGDLNIELSGNYVTAISGHPVGGTGGGGTYYDGDGIYIEITGNNTITLTNEAAGKLNREIPTRVADLTDSADYATKDFADAKYQTKVDMSAYLTTADAANTYQTIEGMIDYVGQQEYNEFKDITNSKFKRKQNNLNFGYDENEAISSIDGHEIAGTGGVTGDYYSASNPSGFINSDQAEAQIIAKKYITSSVSELDNFYSKSQTSGANEIANAIKDFVTEDLLGATSGELKDWVSTNYYNKTETSSKSEISAAIKDFLPKPIGLANDQYYAMTTSGWEIIQGAGDVSGISTVAHDDTLTGNGNNENLGVNTTKIQTKLTDTQIQNITDVTTLKTASSTWDNVSAKLNTTDFNTYTATTAPTTYQPKGDYLSANALEGYATTALLDTISSKIESDIPTTVAQLTDSANYYKKTETSGATELSTEFSKYIQTISTGVGLSGDGKTTSLGIDTTAAINLTNASAKSAVSADKAASAYASKRLQDSTSGPVIQVGDVTAIQNWASSNSSTWDSVTAKLTTAQYANDSATFVTSSNSTIIGTKQYALTTAGWAEVQAGSTFTGVITNDTLTGAGTDSSHKLGVAWSALSSNKIDSAKSAEYITNGVGYSGFNDISAKFDSLTSYVPYSATVLPIGTNNTATNNSIAIGASNTADDLGFAVGQSNTALKRSLAFGVSNYANDISLAIGYQNSASGRNDNNQSAVNIAIGYANSAADHAAAFINVCTAENYAFAAGHGNSAIDNSVAFGRNTSAYFYSFDFGHSNDVRYYSYAFGRELHYEGQWANGSQYGAFVIGGWNATTSYATTADAPLFIIGNGSNNNPSDGFIVYRDGDVFVQGAITSNGGTFTNETVFSAATGTFDNSYIKCVNDGNDGYARFGVGSYGGAVIKTVNGNNNVQVNVKYNANNNELIQIQKNGTTLGNLIPAVTSTTTAGLTDDGILHIIIEN